MWQSHSLIEARVWRRCQAVGVYIQETNVLLYVWGVDSVWDIQEQDCVPASGKYAIT